jgi:magnesium transporter
MTLSEKSSLLCGDQLGKLVGVVPTRRLLMSGPEQRISALMVKGVVAIPQTATVLEACEYFTHHRFLAFPVVNHEGNIQGVVDINLFTDATITVVEQEQAERAFSSTLARGPRPQGLALDQLKDRFPWQCEHRGGIICG